MKVSNLNVKSEKYKTLLKNCYSQQVNLRRKQNIKNLVFGFKQLRCKIYILYYKDEKKFI